MHALRGTRRRAKELCQSDRRCAWAQRLIDKMEQDDIQGRKLLILAGKVYRSGLMQFLWTWFDEIAIPMDGSRIGEHLSWLSERDMK
jgi:hypothetical protein